MELVNGVSVKDLGIYLSESKILVICDLHIGYEEELNKQGVLVPRVQLKDLFSRLDKIVNGLDIDTVVINGDLKHEFGTISEQEWRDTLKVLDYFSQEIILVKGNHDTILGPIAEKRNVKVVDEYLVGDILITHGHKIKDTGCKTIIIGHEHPAVCLEEGGRKECFKCFLFGKWKRKNLIVMPSLNLLTEGTDVLREDLLSPYLTDVSDFEVFVVGDEVLDFGKVKDL